MRQAAAWTRENLAWVAGILEGEGCFFATKRPHATALRVSINMTDEDVLRRVAKVTGLGSVRGPFVNGTTLHKPLWRWNVDKRAEVYALCVAVLPWMCSRRSERIKEVVAAFRDTGRPSWKHGTAHGYQGRGCRCTDCRASNAARSRAHRAKHRQRQEAA